MSNIVILASVPLLLSHDLVPGTVVEAEVLGNSATVKLPKHTHRLTHGQWRLATEADLAPAPVDDMATDPDQLKLIDPVTGTAVPAPTGSTTLGGSPADIFGDLPDPEAVYPWDYAVNAYITADGKVVQPATNIERARLGLQSFEDEHAEKGTGTNVGDRVGYFDPAFEGQSQPVMIGTVGEGGTFIPDAEETDPVLPAENADDMPTDTPSAEETGDGSEGEQNKEGDEDL